jgi:chromosome segregation ATPase
MCDELRLEIESLETREQYLQNRCNNLECKLEEEQINSDKLLNDISELNDYVKELETALAEACLMSKEADPVV